MKLSLSAAGAALAGLLLLNAARADTITLENGKTIQGRIVRREGGQVVILLESGGRLTIPAGRVVMVEPDERQRPERPVLPVGRKPAPKEPAPEEKPAGEGAKEGAGEKEPEEPGQKPGPIVKKPGPKLAARIAGLVRLTGAARGREAQEVRERARAELAAIGEPALPALCAALESQDSRVRTSAAMALGQIGSGKTVRPLLAAIYAGTPRGGGKAAWYEKQYLNECARAFARITGRSFNYDADKVIAGKSSEQMLEWWGRSYKDYGPQVGDELPKPGKEGGKAEEPDPVEEIKKLPARRYAAPPSRVHDR